MNITDWDLAYRENFTPWDKGQASPPLVDWLSRQPLEGTVLVPGCGVGHDVAHMRSLGIEATGLDISPTAIERAMQCYPQHGSCFVQADLFTFEGRFDAIVEHTCLCALPPEWRVHYRDSVLRLLKPGGLLVGVFFINPEMDPGETGPPFGISTDELEMLFEEEMVQLECYVPPMAFPGREGRELVRVMRRVAPT